MKITKQRALELAEDFKIDLSKTPLSEWMLGLKIEQEHDDVTLGDINKVAKIAAAHIKEHPRYYYYLNKMEKLLKTL
jgi:hypothetical protein